MGLVVLFLSTLAFAATGLKPALAILSAPPLFPDGMVAPYTNTVQENLIDAFAEERRVAGLGLKTLTKPERQRRLSEQWATKNAIAARALEASRVTDEAHPGADAKTIEAVYHELVENPVTRVDAVTRYDKRGDVGFCFGRALWVHYRLLRRGIPPAQIAKIFAVGKLRYKKQLWDFHMATLVKGADGKWWAIDSLFEKPLPDDEWRKRAWTFGASQTAPEVRFYVTDPRKFQPAYPAYERKTLTLPELKPFFSELFSPSQR